MGRGRAGRVCTDAVDIAGYDGDKSEVDCDCGECGGDGKDESGGGCGAVGVVGVDECCEGAVCFGGRIECVVGCDGAIDMDMLADLLLLWKCQVVVTWEGIHLPDEAYIISEVSGEPSLKGDRTRPSSTRTGCSLRLRKGIAKSRVTSLHSCAHLHSQLRTQSNGALHHACSMR